MKDSIHVIRFLDVLLLILLAIGGPVALLSCAAPLTREVMGRVVLEQRNQYGGAEVRLDNRAYTTTQSDGFWKLVIPDRQAHEIELVAPGFLPVKLTIAPVGQLERSFIYNAGEVHLEAGDVNGDGRIDNRDMVIIANSYQKKPAPVVSADLNADNKVDLMDLQIAQANFDHQAQTINLQEGSYSVTSAEGSAPSSDFLTRLAVGLTCFALLLLLWLLVTRLATRMNQRREAAIALNPEPAMEHWRSRIATLEGALAELGVLEAEISSLAARLISIRTQTEKMNQLRDE